MSQLTNTILIIYYYSKSWYFWKKLWNGWIWEEERRGKKNIYIFFFIRGNPTPRKAHFVGPDKRVKNIEYTLKL